MLYIYNVYMNIATVITDPLLRLYLVDSDGFAVEFDHVHDLDGIVCIFLSHELHKPIALMELGDAVTRHVHIHCMCKRQEVAACTGNFLKYIIILALK